MDRTAFFLVGVSLVGCSADSQIDLSQETEMITTKPQVIVTNTTELAENPFPADSIEANNSIEADNSAEATNVDAENVYTNDMDAHSVDKSFHTINKAEYPLYTYQPKPPAAKPTLNQTLPVTEEKPVIRKIISPSLMVAGNEVLNLSPKSKLKPKTKPAPQAAKEAAKVTSIPKNPYTIQVIALKDHRGFKHYIEQLSEDNPMWLHEKIVNGTSLFALLYGEYASIEEAELELRKLPKNFIGYGAFVRAFSAIKKSAYPKLKPVKLVYK